MTRRFSECGCVLDDDGRVDDLCGMHGDACAFPHPDGSVAYTPKDAVELNAVFARESYRVGLREFFNEHTLDAA